MHAPFEIHHQKHPIFLFSLYIFGVQRTKWACGQISCFHLNEQLKVINVSTFFVVPRIIGNILRAIKLSKYNMLIKESFTLPNMRGDRDEIYLWYAAISEFKFELITQHHIWQELKQTLITHFEDLKEIFYYPSHWRHHTQI